MSLTVQEYLELSRLIAGEPEGQYKPLSSMDLLY